MKQPEPVNPAHGADPLSSVSHETLARLRQYESLLVKWQKAINLVGPATIPDAWNRHFIDSAQLLPLLPPPGEQSLRLFDLGCGAGFPGLVLAMMRPDLSVFLVESDQKKCAFLSTVSHETKTPVRVVNRRIEHVATPVDKSGGMVVGESVDCPDIVTARALAALDKLLLYVRPWAEKNPDMLCLFPKGAQYMSEIEAAKAVASFDFDQMPSLSDPQGVLLRLWNIRYLAE